MDLHKVHCLKFQSHCYRLGHIILIWVQGSYMSFCSSATPRLHLHCRPGRTYVLCMCKYGIYACRGNRVLFDLSSTIHTYVYKVPTSNGRVQECCLFQRKDRRVWGTLLDFQTFLSTHQQLTRIMTVFSGGCQQPAAFNLDMLRPNTSTHLTHTMHSTLLRNQVRAHFSCEEE